MAHGRARADAIGDVRELTTGATARQQRLCDWAAARGEDGEDHGGAALVWGPARGVHGRARSGRAGDVRKLTMDAAVRQHWLCVWAAAGGEDGDPGAGHCQARSLWC